MTARALLFAVPLAVATALPAAAIPPTHPTPPTQCATFLALAPTGQRAGCDTLGSPPSGPGRPYRQISVAVQTGAVHATLECSEGRLAELDVAAPFTGSGSVPLPETMGSYCWISLTALFDRTTAVAVTTWTYLID